MSKCVFVPQEGFGIIRKKIGPQMIGTFGCGPCIGILLVSKYAAACAHVSTYPLTNGLRSMLHFFERLITDDTPWVPKTKVYLIGGRSNEKTKQSVLDILFEEQFSGLNIIIKNDDCCKLPHVSNILFDFATGEIESYVPTGLEEIDEIEEMRIKASLFGALVDPNWNYLIWCYNPDYPRWRYIMNYTSERLPYGVLERDYDRPIIWACRTGHCVLVKLLLSDPPSVRHLTFDDFTSRERYNYEIREQHEKDFLSFQSEQKKIAKNKKKYHLQLPKYYTKNMNLPGNPSAKDVGVKPTRGNKFQRKYR